MCCQSGALCTTIRRLGTGGVGPRVASPVIRVKRIPDIPPFLQPQIGLLFPDPPPPPPPPPCGAFFPPPPPKPPQKNPPTPPPGPPPPSILHQRLKPPPPN